MRNIPDQPKWATCRIMFDADKVATIKPITRKHEVKAALEQWCRDYCKGGYSVAVDFWHGIVFVVADFERKGDAAWFSHIHKGVV
ncbi:hypothetical protein EWE75_24100 [Sphingomonas populi]|uniref:Uncharacterized protein n=1 Tax=Sphingomonas populi TaxID=2484750 RepID=A0A4Q6XGL8_9SPHN|nr:hypothetical protein [Sphingomonas populi]RZF59021.1 hypothetical protein EWE75_24100 [Sphingomonas populi]